MDRPIIYRQYDSRWGALDYSAKGESTTIAKAGCGITCTAMVIATLKDKSVTPKETAKWSKAHGYKALHQGTYYTYFKPQLAEYGIKCRQMNNTNVYGNLDASVHYEVKQELLKGNLIIAVMGKGAWTSSGHFVLAYKTDGNLVYINDPASEKSMRECNSLSVWQSQVKYYWVIEVDESVKGDDEVVTDRPVTIFGKNLITKGIFKDNANYLSPKILADVGFKVSNDGDRPIVSMDDIPVVIRGNEHVVKGVNSNGTIYVGIRELLEAIGLEVGWEDGKVTVK